MKQESCRLSVSSKPPALDSTRRQRSTSRTRSSHLPLSVEGRRGADEVFDLCLRCQIEGMQVLGAAVPRALDAPADSITGPLRVRPASLSQKASVLLPARIVGCFDEVFQP